MTSSEPPVAKYELTVTIRGNTHAEILSELVTMTRGSYQLASDHFTRDEFDSCGGRDTMTLRHTNPDMTPERYSTELSEWAERDRREWAEEKRISQGDQ